MISDMQRTDRNNDTCCRGYSLVEMLIVTGIILVLATIPIALIRGGRDKIYEADALKSLRMMSLAYENYYAQNGYEYPHYSLNHVLEDEIQFRTAEEIWDHMIAEKLLPNMYSGRPHNENDLLAKGYRFTIFPARAGQPIGDGVRNSYAFAMMPYEDSPATRGIAMVRGNKFYTSFPSAVPRKMDSDSLDGVVIYSLND